MGMRIYHDWGLWDPRYLHVWIIQDFDSVEILAIVSFANAAAGSDANLNVPVPENAASAFHILLNIEIIL